MMASILSVACVNILNSDMWPCAKVDEGKNNGRVYKLRVAVSPGKTQKADKGTPRSAKSGEEIRDQWVDVPPPPPEVFWDGARGAWQLRL